MCHGICNFGSKMTLIHDERHFHKQFDVLSKEIDAKTTNYFINPKQLVALNRKKSPISVFRSIFRHLNNLRISLTSLFCVIFCLFFLIQ